MHYSKRSSLGFTLIELLVVIAIIAILAAILFPVFATVRARARAIQGLNNTKQMALGIQMYSNDYDATFPRSGWTGPGGNNEHPGNITGGQGQWSDVVGPFIRSGGIVSDISDSSKYTGGPNPINGIHSLLLNDLLSHDPLTANNPPYGDNDWADGDSTQEGTQRAKGENTVVAPADCVLLIEGHCAWENSGKSYDGFDSGGLKNKFLGENNISQYNDANITGTTYDGWHFIDGLPIHNQGTGTNAAFVDGHAKYYRVTDGQGNNTIANTLPFRKNIDPTQAGMGNGDWQTRGLKATPRDNWR